MQGCIFSCELERFPHPHRKVLKSVSIFVDFFVAPRETFQVFTPFSNDFFPFSMLFLPLLLFPSLIFCFSHLFFNMHLFFFIFSPVNFSHLEKLPRPLEKFPRGGGGLFQENIRPWKNVWEPLKYIEKDLTCLIESSTTTLIRIKSRHQTKN